MISRLNRSTETVAASSNGRTLMTTVRPSVLSRATNTLDIPPPPSSRSTVKEAPKVRCSSSRRTVTSRPSKQRVYQTMARSTLETADQGRRLSDPRVLTEFRRFRSSVPRRRPVAIFSRHGRPRRSLRSRRDQRWLGFRRLYRLDRARSHCDRHVHPQTDVPSSDGRDLARPGLGRHRALRAFRWVFVQVVWRGRAAPPLFVAG